MPHTPEEVFNQYNSYLSTFETEFLQSMMFSESEITENQQALIDKFAAKYEQLAKINTIQLPSKLLTLTQNNILKSYKNTKKITSKQHLEFIQAALALV